MQKGRILAIDYGAKHIGLAMSDPDQLIAFGRGKLVNGNFEYICEKLLNLIIDESVSKILIGLPFGANGEETLQTERIRKFSSEFKNFLVKRGINIEIEFVDESFSSYEAGVLLDEIGIPSERKKETEDELAAVVLMRRYIDLKS